MVKYNNVLNIDIGTNCGICIYIPRKKALIATTFRMKYNNYQENSQELSEAIREIILKFKIKQVNIELVSVKISSDKALASHWFFYGVIQASLNRDTLLKTLDPMTIRSRAIRGNNSNKGITTGTKGFSLIYVNSIYKSDLSIKDGDAVDAVLVHLATECDKKAKLTHYKAFREIFNYGTK